MFEWKNPKWLIRFTHIYFRSWTTLYYYGKLACLVGSLPYVVVSYISPFVLNRDSICILYMSICILILCCMYFWKEKLQSEREHLQSQLQRELEYEVARKEQQVKEELAEKYGQELNRLKQEREQVGEYLLYNATSQ